MKGGQLKNMKIELSQEELNLLIESVTDSKNDILRDLENDWYDEFPIIDDISDLTKNLENLYLIKNKLCNYSILNQGEN